MNVEILTDGTADLFYLENAIDVMSLVNAGLLQDLYPLMEADAEFLTEDYYENVWEAMELDGSLYEISGGFQIGAIAAPKSLVGDRTGWTIDEYQEFASQLEEPFLLQSQSAMLYQMTAYAFIDGPVTRNFVGFENFISLFHNLSFRLAAKNTAIFTGISVPAAVILN